MTKEQAIAFVEALVDLEVVGDDIYGNPISPAVYRHLVAVLGSGKLPVGLHYFGNYAAPLKAGLNQCQNLENLTAYLQDVVFALRGIVEEYSGKPSP